MDEIVSEEINSELKFMAKCEIHIDHRLLIILYENLN